MNLDECPECGADLHQYVPHERHAYYHRERDDGVHVIHSIPAMRDHPQHEALQVEGFRRVPARKDGALPIARDPDRDVVVHACACGDDQLHYWVREYPDSVLAERIHAAPQPEDGSGVSA